MKFLFAFALVLFPVSVLACVCDGDQTVKQAYKESTAVFAGRFIAEEYRTGIKDQFAEMEAESSGKKREYEVLVYRFVVTRWYKGDNNTSEAILVTDRVRYLDDRSEVVSDCGLGFKTSESYLVYAYGEPDDLSTNACSLTKRLARARADLDVLERLRKRD